ncbi:MAG: hypothetical protein CVT48_03425 [Thermoplasmata archaeon HGW-Thermoplasmata-1]|nr:MAG: hypothetical protein CVT48_03425 [Thermoplasmata archaeon HGW-Thermoplasmata-1]
MDESLERVYRHYEQQGFEVKRNFRISGNSGAAHQVDVLAQGRGKTIAVIVEERTVPATAMVEARLLARDIGAKPVVASAEGFSDYAKQWASRYDVELLDINSLSPLTQYTPGRVSSAEPLTQHAFDRVSSAEPLPQHAPCGISLPEGQDVFWQAPDRLADFEEMSEVPSVDKPSEKKRPAEYYESPTTPAWPEERTDFGRQGGSFASARQTISDGDEGDRDLRNDFSTPRRYGFQDPAQDARQSRPDVNPNSESKTQKENPPAWFFDAEQLIESASVSKAGYTLDEETAGFQKTTGFRAAEKPWLNPNASREWPPHSSTYDALQKRALQKEPAQSPEAATSRTYTDRRLDGWQTDLLRRVPQISRSESLERAATPSRVVGNSEWLRKLEQFRLPEIADLEPHGRGDYDFVAAANDSREMKKKIARAKKSGLPHSRRKRTTFWIVLLWLFAVAALLYLIVLALSR